MAGEQNKKLDGVVTNIFSILLILRTTDCSSVLFYRREMIEGYRLSTCGVL
ncbi:hypothetical protein [secondary endosymbiont of Ctenarytaina eucalypti]|uniref:hypothetical protein n=1 Tax=secondary endosymbiont of Ctenarytaina eucalypti TaxID=1199245 RepID=UPI0038994A62